MAEKGKYELLSTSYGEANKIANSYGTPELLKNNYDDVVSIFNKYGKTYRKDMPRIRTKNILLLQKRLLSGHIDINKPFAPDTNPTNPFPQGLSKDQARNFLVNGLRDGDEEDDKIKVVLKSVSIKKLKPIQHQVYLSEVFDMIHNRDIKYFESTFFLCTNDYFILDGHHRFVGARLFYPDIDVRVLLVDLPLKELLPLLLTYTTAIGNVRNEGKSWSRVHQEQYSKFAEYVKYRNEGRLNELNIPSFLNRQISFIKELAINAAIKFDDLLKLFLHKKVYEFFSKIKWSLKSLFDILKKGHKLYLDLINEISRYLANNKVVKWSQEELKKLDTWLNNHPKFKRISGIIVAGLLLFIWFNMSFIGDIEYDFDLTDILYALNGSYSLANIFSGQQGVKLLLLFATGSLLKVSFPWPGPTSVKFILASIKSLSNWVGVKLHTIKESLYMQQMKQVLIQT